MPQLNNASVEGERFPDYYISEDLKKFSIRKLHVAAQAQIARAAAEIFWLYIYQLTQHQMVSHIELVYSAQEAGSPYQHKTINFYVQQEQQYILFPLIAEEAAQYRSTNHFKFESHLWNSPLKIKTFMTPEFSSLKPPEKEKICGALIKQCKIQSLAEKNEFLKNPHSAYTQHFHTLSWPQTLSRGSDINQFMAQILPQNLGFKRLALIEKDEIDKSLGENVSLTTEKNKIQKI